MWPRKNHMIDLFIHCFYLPFYPAIHCVSIRQHNNTCTSSCLIGSNVPCHLSNSYVMPLLKSKSRKGSSFAININMYASLSRSFKGTYAEFRNWNQILSLTLNQTLNSDTEFRYIQEPVGLHWRLNPVSNTSSCRFCLPQITVTSSRAPTISSWTTVAWRSWSWATSGRTGSAAKHSHYEQPPLPAFQPSNMRDMLPSRPYNPAL